MECKEGLWWIVGCAWCVVGLIGCGDNSADPMSVGCEPETAPVCLGELAVSCDPDGAGVVVHACARNGTRCENGACVEDVEYTGAPDMPVGSGATPHGATSGATSSTTSAPRPNMVPEQPSTPEPQPNPGRTQPPEPQSSIVIRESHEHAPSQAPTGGCPRDMVWVDGACMDRYEAPNRQGAYPLIMYSFNEAEAWCQARGKRLCYDDEWTRACAGPRGTAYPYGVRRQPGRCNDDKTWRRYDGPLLRQWPRSASGPGIVSLDEQYTRAGRTRSGAESVDHVRELYQATRSGAKRGCGGHYGVYDLVGNVEEWTRRRDGGDGGVYVGRLKGRFWGEARTCQSGVSNHGNAFRFYETGFRCCADPRGD